MQDCVWSILQAGNLYSYTMNNPVMFVDPSGLRAFTTTLPSFHRYNRYTLRVVSFDGWASFAAWSFVPFSSVAVPLARWTQGYRSIDGNLADNAVAIAQGIEIGLGIAKPLTLLFPGFFSTGVSAAGILSGQISGSQPMREAVFNSFHREMWHSQTREEVEDRFAFALGAMSQLLASGDVVIKRASDVFSNSTFGTRFAGGAMGAHQFDHLLGRYRYFMQDNLYFFPTSQASHGMLMQVQSEMAIFFNIQSSSWRR